MTRTLSKISQIRKRDYRIRQQYPFGSQNVYPISMIWQYFSNIPVSLEAFHQELETRKLVANLTKQRDQLAHTLPNPFVLQVPTTEQGPQFAALTVDSIQQHLRGPLGKNVPDFQIKGTILFSLTFLMGFCFLSPCACKHNLTNFQKIANRILKRFCHSQFLQILRFSRSCKPTYLSLAQINGHVNAKQKLA